MPSFVTYDQLTLSFQIYPESGTIAGKYVLMINLTDSHPITTLSKQYVLEIDVVAFTLQQYQSALNHMQ